MARYKFGEIVKEVKINIDRNNNPYDYYVAGDHMDSEDFIIRRKGCFATDDVGPAFTRLFKPGQVLYGSRRTYLKKIAVADFEGICSNTTFVLETKDNSVFLQELLPYIMLSDGFTNWSISHSKGSTNPYVLFSDLADFELELPNLETQRKIARQLLSAQRVKESYRSLLLSTDELVKSQFIEMFGTMSNAKYDVLPMVSICERSGQYGSNSSACDYIIGTPRYIRITDINDDGSLNDDVKSAETIDDKYLLSKGDLVFARTGATVGKTYLHHSGKAIYAGYLIKYHPVEDRICPEYLFAYTHSAPYYTWVELTKKVGAQPNISATQYDMLPVIVPPVEIQREFVMVAEQADKSKFELKKSIEAIDKVIKSLINSI